jgi:hypothetical protein
MKKAFELGKYVIANVGVNLTFTSHHFLMWVYEGKDLDAFPPTLVDGTACLDFGPSDTNQRTLVGGSQSPKLVTRLPRGVAQEIKPLAGVNGKPEIGIILNTHWINSSDKPQRAAVKVKLVAAKRQSVKRHLLPIFEVLANAFIKVPPGEVRTVSAAWGAGTFNIPGGLGGGATTDGPACVVMLTAHMHKRGKLFTVDLMSGGVAQKRVLETDSYSDPPQVTFTPPMLLQPGQQLKYTCTHDNSADVRLGCEEQAGVVPGVDAATTFLSSGGRRTSGAARRCESDADCAGFGTGRCVPANLVFGYTSDDDMCILPGGFYPPNDQGGCDL